MEFPVLTVNPAKIETACLVVPVFKDGDLLPAADKLDDASERLIGQLLDRGDFEPSLGNVQLIPFAPGLGAERLLLVGLGERAKCGESQLIKALDAAFGAIAKLPLDDVAVTFTDVPVGERDTAWKARVTLEAAHRACYRFDEFKSEPAPAPRLSSLTLLVGDEDQAAQAELGARVGAAVGEGVSLTRTLGNLPGNVCTPRYLADQAQRLADGADGALNVEILDEDALEALGANALLAVGQGSAEPSRLIVMEYRGAEDPEEAPHILVGKGIQQRVAIMSQCPRVNNDASRCYGRFLYVVN